MYNSHVMDKPNVDRITIGNTSLQASAYKTMQPEADIYLKQEINRERKKSN